VRGALALGAHTLVAGVTVPAATLARVFRRIAPERERE
jgi:hypothetical protein